jgi:GNAT superfamily N-acetyltransferase
MTERPVVKVGSPAMEDRRALMEQLLAFNRAATGITDDGELYSFTRDEKGELVAGLYGWYWGGTCEIALLWVRDGYRGHGLGGGMLDAAEEKARELACHQMLLSTHSFQALDFYRARGYESLLAVDDYPRGHRDYLLRKAL